MCGKTFKRANGVVVGFENVFYPVINVFDSDPGEPKGNFVKISAENYEVETFYLYKNLHDYPNVLYFYEYFYTKQSLLNMKLKKVKNVSI